MAANSFQGTQCVARFAVPVWLLLGAVLCCGQAGVLTVRDAIEMQAFIDPYPFASTALSTSEVKYSPDRRFCAAVTQRGVLTTNRLESTIWIFDIEQVRRFLTSTPEASPPEPRAVARMAAVTNNSSISHMRWLTVRKLAFLAQDETSYRSVFVVDVISGSLEKLTPNEQDVTEFDISGNTLVYTVSEPVHQGPYPIERVATGRSLQSLLNEHGPDFLTYYGLPAKLWMIRGKNASLVLNGLTGKPLELTTDLISLSPTGHSAVVTQYADHIPKEWEEYEPFPCPACELFRLKASPRRFGGDDRMFQSLMPKQYALIDLDHGTVEPLDAPLGLTLLYSGPQKAIWSQDGRTVILVDTYLPLGDKKGTERQERLQVPCVALFDTASRRIDCVAPIKQTSREEYSRTGTARYLNDVKWDESFGELTFNYRVLGTESTSTRPEQHALETYRQGNGLWSQVASEEPKSDAPIWIGVCQDLDVPPSLVVSKPNGQGARKLWDPNPQLQSMNLGEVSIFRWKDENGRDWAGGLVKPPGYSPARRYPLVIQTHGFNQHEFMTVGAFTTAFAARPIAARGIVVLQVEDKADLMATPDEARIHIEGYEAAIDRLAANGLVDPARVGVIGFSRTGYYVLEALTKRPERFVAATIADSDFLGYMQRLLSVDSDPRDMRKEEGIKIYGNQPFGNGLKRWLKEAPAFNLDKISAPVRIEAHDLSSLLLDWELYAGLRLQGKPVDLIQLPDAVHIVTKPLERFASEEGDVDWFDYWLNGHEDTDPTKSAQYARWHLLFPLAKH
jgi:hypothetical protein